MFDGLKDKFSKFTSDVEEEAETDADATVDESADAQSNEEEKDAANDSDGEDVTMGERVKAAATGKHVITEEELEDPLNDLELYLLQHDVEISTANEILDGVRERLVGEQRSQLSSTEGMAEDALKQALLDVLAPSDFDFEQYVQEAEKPVTVAFTGVNGVGKTTTIAKLAQRLMEQGYNVVLANGDTYRAGANEQLQKHADNLGVEMISHGQGGDPAAVLYDAVEYAEANEVDVVLGDTAGRLHTSDDLMKQLEKIDRVVEPDLTIFVDEAVAGQDAIKRAQEFDAAAEIDGSVLTKADADAEGGAAISISHVTGKPILFIGNGQQYDDLVEFHPDLYIDFLMD